MKRQPHIRFYAHAPKANCFLHVEEKLAPHAINFININTNKNE